MDFDVINKHGWTLCTRPSYDNPPRSVTFHN
jgi:hypothetical protein